VIVRRLARGDDVVRGIATDEAQTALLEDERTIYRSLGGVRPNDDDVM